MTNPADLKPLKEINFDDQEELMREYELTEQAMETVFAWMRNTPNKVVAKEFVKQYKELQNHKSSIGFWIDDPEDEL